MIMKHSMLWTVFFAIAGLSFGQAKAPHQPIIDIHLHSESLANLKTRGPNPVTGEKAPASVEEHVRQTLSMMSRCNIVQKSRYRESRTRCVGLGAASGLLVQ